LIFKPNLGVNQGRKVTGLNVFKMAAPHNKQGRKMSLLTTMIKTFSAAIMAITLSYSTLATAASMPAPAPVIQAGQLVGITNIDVAGYGLYDVTFNGQYQGNVYSQAFVQASGIAGFNLITGNGMFQGSVFDLMPQLTRGCGATATVLCDWVIVFDEQPNPFSGLANVCAGLPTSCTASSPLTPFLSVGVFNNFGGSDDSLDALSFLFGLPALDLPGLTYLDWTPSKVSEVPVPAALFMFAPALLGFLGLRRKRNT
jgi:hypothetical protein